MRKSITVDLGHIDDAIQELEELRKRMYADLQKYLEALMNQGVDIAKAKVVELGAVYTGDLAASLSGRMYAEDGKAVIFTDSDHAAFVEFGTGVMGQTNPAVDAPEGWTYDVNEHGDKGWYYWDESAGKVRWTKGMPSRPFMYETTQDLRGKADAIAKEVLANG